MTISYKICDIVRCTSESKRLRGRIREGLRRRVYSRTRILWLTRNNKSWQDVSQVPLIPSVSAIAPGMDQSNFVIFEVGLPGDTWFHRVERRRLAEKSEWFRAMLMGPMAPAPSDPPPILKIQHVDKRAFKHLCEFLKDEPVHFQSVTTARSTLDAAHQYLCPGLAKLAVKFLEANLNSSTALEVYQGLSLYATDPISGISRSPNSPSAPSAPGDDAAEIATACTMLLSACLAIVDMDPEVVLEQERFEDLNMHEVAFLASRDSLRLGREIVLFNALERWAVAECRKNGLEHTGQNKRNALPDAVWYSVRYLLMTDKEFINGPMKSGILSYDEASFIIGRILGHHQDNEVQPLRADATLSRLSCHPRASKRFVAEQRSRMSNSWRKEREDNKRNRRKECANQGHKACARLGDCLIRVLACVFD